MLWWVTADAEVKVPELSKVLSCGPGQSIALPAFPPAGNSLFIMSTFLFQSASLFTQSASNIRAVKQTKKKTNNNN